MWIFSFHLHMCLLSSLQNLSRPPSNAQYEDMQSHDYDITYWNIYSLYLDKYINIHIYHEYMIGAPATLLCTGRKEVNWHLMNKRKVEMHDCS